MESLNQDSQEFIELTWRFEKTEAKYNMSFRILPNPAFDAVLGAMDATQFNHRDNRYFEETECYATIRNIICIFLATTIALI
jgi:hypothetical protein